MLLSPEICRQLNHFVETTAFRQHGALITDLDGTAVHTHHGRYCVPPDVESGLKAVYQAGRPVIINSLRFPISVMRTFGAEWYRISGTPIPTVLLNGAMLGYIHEDAGGEQRYEELKAFPMEQEDVWRALNAVKILNHTVPDRLLVFYYPRDWTKGEMIWTPCAERVPSLAAQYPDATSIWSGSLAELEQALTAEDICMVYLFTDAPGAGHKPYRHATRRDFFTRQGVDKLSGSARMAALLGFRMEASLGAGDSSMDVFLRGVGQAVHVGKALEFQSRQPPILARDSAEFAALLLDLVAMLQPTTAIQPKDAP